MRWQARHLLPLLTTPFLASCVFLLNYDDLQRGSAEQVGGGRSDGGASTADAAGASVMAGATNTSGGTTSESGAPSAASGAAGESANTTCNDCDDHDPCTIDTCDETGDAPTCRHDATEGLMLDGFETTLSSPQHVRVSLAAGGQQFFLSALEGPADAPKLSLFRLASDGTALEPIGADLKLDGVPISNVGLTVEDVGAGEVALHGFLAAKLKTAGATAKVFHVVNRANKTTATPVGLSYKEGNPYVFPQALQLADRVVGAWIQADGTIAVHNVGTVRTDTFGAVTLPATTLSLLSTADDQPAILFTASTGPKLALGTYVETAGQSRTKVPECETRAGDYVSSSVIGTQKPGLWLAYMTRVGDQYLTTGSGSIVCGSNACAAVAEDCTTAAGDSGLRDVAGTSAHFPDDPADLVYSVVALPRVALKNGSSALEGQLSLVLGRTDFGAPGKPASTTIGGNADGIMEIAHNDTSADIGYAGPDWPAVSILPTKQVAVAWIQPSASAAGTELHVQRYKMCLPPP